MISDRKMLAAGDDSTSQEDPKTAKTELKASLSRCKECGKMREYFKACHGCKELRKEICLGCGVPFRYHFLHVRSRSGMRIWVRNDNHLVWCRPENDPVKQRQIIQRAPMTPRSIWVNIEES